MATKPIPEVKVVAIEPKLVTDIAATLTTPGATPKGEPPPTIPTTLLSELSTAIPLPIPVTAPEPLPVTVVDSAPVPPPVLVTKGDGVTLQPTTTEQADKVVERQSRVSMLWEISQATISISITFAVIYCAINKIQSSMIENAFFLLAAFYFHRTNATAIGGTGAKANEQYNGRML